MMSRFSRSTCRMKKIQNQFIECQRPLKWRRRHSKSFWHFIGRVMKAAAASARNLLKNFLLKRDGNSSNLKCISNYQLALFKGKKFDIENNEMIKKWNSRAKSECGTFRIQKNYEARKINFAFMIRQKHIHTFKLDGGGERWWWLQREWFHSIWEKEKIPHLINIQIKQSIFKWISIYQ